MGAIKLQRYNYALFDLSLNLANSQDE